MEVKKLELPLYELLDARLEGLPDDSSISEPAFCHLTKPLQICFPISRLPFVFGFSRKL